MLILPDMGNFLHSTFSHCSKGEACEEKDPFSVRSSHSVPPFSPSMNND